MLGDGPFGAVSTYFKDMREIILITHIVQGHYPCCSHWLLCGLGFGINLYSVMRQAVECLLLAREELENIPACIQGAKSTPLISEYLYVSLIVVTSCSYLIERQMFVMHDINILNSLIHLTKDRIFDCTFCCRTDDVPERRCDRMIAVDSVGEVTLSTDPRDSCTSIN